MAMMGALALLGGACGAPPGKKPDTACAIEATDPSLPGARVRIEGASCRVRSGERQIFTYRLDLAGDIPYTSVDSGADHGMRRRHLRRAALKPA
ncbi:MAG: hypothetical protein ABUR63_07745 [Verrucomicrobiota bacterium]